MSTIKSFTITVKVDFSIEDYHAHLGMIDDIVPSAVESCGIEIIKKKIEDETIYDYYDKNRKVNHIFIKCHK